MVPRTIAARAAAALLVAAAIACGPPIRDAQGGGEPIVPPPPPPPPPPRPTSCGLAITGPAWILEGEALHLGIACANGDPVPASAVLEGLPAGVALDRPAGTVDWRTGLADAGVYDVVVRVPGDGEARLRVGVVDRWDAEGNVPPDPARYTEEYGLPVLHLQVARTVSSSEYVPASLTYRGRRHAIEVKYRGTRSIDFPKKSYTLAFPDSAQFSDPVLGFPPRKKLLLVTTFDDSTQIRDRLALGLWRRVADAPIDVRTASAVLYLNGAYRGVYVMSEKLGGQVLSAHGLDGDGDLFQAKTNLANFYATSDDGQPKLTWHDGYEKEEGTPPQGAPGAFDDLDALVELVASADDATFAAQLPRLADVDELRDWWVLVMLAHSSDCARKNVFLYHDPLGGPWRATVWDYGASLGQDWRTEHQSATASEEFVWENGLFRRLLAPPFASGTRARLGEAVRERVPVADVLAAFDLLVAETAAAAARDEARWRGEQLAFFGNEGRAGFPAHDEEVAYTRRWIAARWAYLAGRY